ncbi:MAG: hypothetical protein KZQ83_11745 [gamma proteobacterium symbiont of Taylorina sp.]|nr:hypothetical protein [gamma proteobacterium symbiont of Taylorina sp.]
MNSVSSVYSSNYLDMVHQATRRNTLTQVVDAKQSGNSVDVEKLQQSNQELRDNARETGVELYSQKLTKQAFETYANAAQNTPDYSNTNSSSDSSESSSVYSFDAQQVNDMRQTAQKRAFAASYYDNQTSQPQPAEPDFATRPVSVYV